MRILNLAGRLSLAIDDKAIDVETASDGAFTADIQAIYPRWEEFRAWAAAYRGAPDREVAAASLGPPAPRPPQGFATGLNYRDPAVVTPDELAEPDDIELGCRLAGEQMQHGRTRDFVFTIPQLVAYLSQILPLLPGDLIFTGTPSGIGWVRQPRRTIAAGEELVT